MNRIEFGDCRETMRRWKQQGIKAQTCVTSPPYYGLRDYGHAGQIGLEKTPEEYISAMVEVFRCVWDVLEDDGTLWLNIGDSYAANRGYQVPSTLMNGDATNEAQAGAGKGMKAAEFGLKPKDLIGIPWMLAFALRADGWYLRQDIIWHKPNPMPESVRDRCTKAHEYVFLMSKQERYFFDSEAMQEEAVCGFRGSEFHTGNTAEHQLGRASKKPRESKVRGEFNGKTNAIPGREAFRAIRETRNRRSVWTVTTQPYSGAHFAVFPPALIEPCILAGAPVGGIVLDPFMGSGTTAQVAQKLGRQYIGCELNPDYGELQNSRTRQGALELA